MWPYKLRVSVKIRPHSQSPPALGPLYGSSSVRTPKVHTADLVSACGFDCFPHTSSSFLGLSQSTLAQFAVPLAQSPEMGLFSALFEFLLDLSLSHPLLAKTFVYPTSSCLLGFYPHSSHLAPPLAPV